MSLRSSSTSRRCSAADAGRAGGLGSRPPRLGLRTPRGVSECPVRRLEHASRASREVWRQLDTVDGAVLARADEAALEVALGGLLPVPKGFAAGQAEPWSVRARRTSPVVVAAVSADVV